MAPAWPAQLTGTPSLAEPRWSGERSGNFGGKHVLAASPISWVEHPVLARCGAGRDLVGHRFGRGALAINVWPW